MDLVGLALSRGRSTADSNATVLQNTYEAQIPNYLTNKISLSISQRLLPLHRDF
jgi:hypothetical protein